MKELKVIKREPGLLDILGDFNAPFTDVVKNATLLEKFKMPQLDSYHEQLDPVAHVEIFKNLMLVQDIPNYLKWVRKGMLQEIIV